MWFHQTEDSNTLFHKKHIHIHVNMHDIDKNINVCIYYSLCQTRGLYNNAYRTLISDHMYY